MLECGGSSRGRRETPRDALHGDLVGTVRCKLGFKARADRRRGDGAARVRAARDHVVRREGADSRTRAGPRQGHRQRLRDGLGAPVHAESWEEIARLREFYDTATIVEAFRGDRARPHQTSDVESRRT